MKTNTLPPPVLNSETFASGVAEHLERVLNRHPANSAMRIEREDYNALGQVTVGQHEYELCRIALGGRVRNKAAWSDIEERGIHQVADAIGQFFLDQQSLSDLIFADHVALDGLEIPKHRFICLGVKMTPGRVWTDYVVSGAFGAKPGTRKLAFSMCQWYQIDWNEA